MLTKVSRYVFVQGTPGRPGLDPFTVCMPPLPPPPPASHGGGGGGGGVVCTTGCVPIGTNPDGSTDYMCGVPVCRST